MNYLKEILAFHDWLETNQCDATAQALWYQLMAINNRCGWSVWFTVANMTLQAKLGGIDRKTLDRKRNNLILKGRIEYSNQGKKQAGKYRIIPFGDIIAGNIPLETGLSVPSDGLNLSTLNKLNKTKQNKKENNPPISLPQKNKPDKKLFGEFVELTEEEHARLLSDYGEQDLAWMIQRLDIYLGQNEKNRKKYTSHNHVLRGWVSDRLKEEKQKQGNVPRLRPRNQKKEGDEVDWGWTKEN